MRTWLVTIILILLSDCLMTRSVTEENDKYDDMQREFNRNFSESFKTYEGKYDGETVRNGERYYLLKFPCVLLGEGRIFNILVPVVFEGASSDDRPILFETSETAQTDGSAFYIEQKELINFTVRTFAPPDSSPLNYINDFDYVFKMKNDQPVVFVSHLEYYKGF